ncbi:putative monocarboxylate transporter mch1 [Orbilia blumenaviensis]|uniref:Probable transporter MCH1 n=1 Tax=Orbilia blumenaviensis TaxID=1796055 RepID=A0AAV9VJQ4_9PEZI
MSSPLLKPSGDTKDGDFRGVRNLSISAGTSRSITPSPPSPPPSEILSIRRRRRLKWHRYSAGACALVSCLSAGSILLYSLYTPLFQHHLRYSQMQINTIAIAAELGMYLMVPIFGWICDNYGPDRLSILSACLFVPGYLSAAYCYNNKLQSTAMFFSFFLIGSGTVSMYLTGITTCAKNFTKRRGLALAVPISAFGLSPLWMSQVANAGFMKDSEDGSGTRELDINRIYKFFAIYLLAIGLLGSCFLKIYPDPDLDEVVLRGETAPLLASSPTAAEHTEYGAAVLSNDPNDIPPAVKRRLLNDDTRNFLSDPTMWWFAAGVFLTAGPGESFINNMGALIKTIQPVSRSLGSSAGDETATHVGIIAVTSTIARLFSGFLSDYLGPPVEPAPVLDEQESKRFRISRIMLIIIFAGFMQISYLILSSGYIQLHPQQFYIISSLIGIGYGAVFTLSPTIVSVVWGVENLATNWGIIAMLPAGGASVFGFLFAAVYDSEAKRQNSGEHGLGEGLCFGLKCYQRSFAGMTASCMLAIVLWAWGWRGRGGWMARGVSV